MLIQLNKFGVTLNSRQMGKEALGAFNPVLTGAGPDEMIFVDFGGVNTFSPSWGDEFLTPLHNKFGDRLILKETKNPSVIATIKIYGTVEIKFDLPKPKIFATLPILC